MHASNFGRGKVLQPVISTDKYDTKDFKEVPFVDSIPVLTKKKNELTILQ